MVVVVCTGPHNATAYLDAYCNVLSVSWMLDSAADIQASMTVRLLPPSESCRKRVSFDSLYGTWAATGADVSARMTFPSDSKPFEEENVIIPPSKTMTRAKLHLVDAHTLLQARPHRPRLLRSLRSRQVHQMQLGLDVGSVLVLRLGVRSGS